MIPRVAALLEPVLALAAVGVLALILRWIYADTRRPRSRPSAPKADYGLLAPIASLPEREVAARMRHVLIEHGIRATLAAGPAGQTLVLVFRTDAHRARTLLTLQD